MSEWPTLPRWTPLPGDPPELRRWLASREAETSDYPEDWPKEEPR